MKIINKIAVEPSSLPSWETFRYVMEKLGFSSGLVLAKYPKSWSKQLLDKLDVGDIERQRIVTKLGIYKNDRMVSSGLSYQPDLSWIDNIKKKLDGSDIEKILVTDASDIESNNKTISTPHEVGEEFFDAPRDVNVLNTPKELSSIADSLLVNTSLAIFVDPFFRIDRTSAYLDTLGELAHVAAQYDKCKRFMIYTHRNVIPHSKGSEIEQAFNKKILPNVQPGFEITVRYIDDEQSEHPLHARYLLADKGGLRYDKGFQPGRPPVHVDISLLDSKMHKVLFERFANKFDGYQIEFEYVWTAKNT